MYYDSRACCEPTYKAKAATTRPKRPALEAPSLMLEAALVEWTTPVLVLEAPKVLAEALLLLSLLEATDGVRMRRVRNQC